MNRNYVIKTRAGTYWDDAHGRWVENITPDCKFGTAEAAGSAWASMANEDVSCRIVPLRRKPRATKQERLLALRRETRRTLVVEVLNLISAAAARTGAPDCLSVLAIDVNRLEPER